MVASLKADYPLSLLLSIAGLARSTFFYHQKRFGQRPDPYVQVRARIREIFTDSNERYGHRKIMTVLVKEGLSIAKKTVLRLMQDMGIKTKVRRKRYNSHRGTVGRVAGNVLNRDFTAEEPNEKWVSDVTEFAVADQKLYLSPVIDLFDTSVVSYSMSTSPNTALTNESLIRACQGLRPGQAPLVHTDQGFQYQHVSWAAILAEYGATPSMSRKGNCWDNAVAENFFGQLKSEMFYLQKFDTVEDLKTAIDEYIHWYNFERISTRLGGLAPMEYRTKTANATEAVTALC
ncbi:IS3 family transposase [Brevibacterium siliguriense]|uniref:IS3 family transposase n=1 Tax=Brevibacterium siliguriense TaxID=1136497 RepID=UPI001E560FCD|nr:IS3 family transposase [Brevibacterium siliguriense]